MKGGVESADERIADIEQKLKLLEHILLEKTTLNWKKFLIGGRMMKIL